MILSAKYEAIAVLRDRRTQILREIDQLGAKAKKQKKDVAHIEACLKIFGASTDPEQDRNPREETR